MCVQLYLLQQYSSFKGPSTACQAFREKAPGVKRKALKLLLINLFKNRFQVATNKHWINIQVNEIRMKLTFIPPNLSIPWHFCVPWSYYFPYRFEQQQINFQAVIFSVFFQSNCNFQTTLRHNIILAEC